MSVVRELRRFVRDRGGKNDRTVSHFDQERDGRVVDLRAFFPGQSGYDSGADVVLGGAEARSGHMEYERDRANERALAAESELEKLRAELKRHRDANLVRLVMSDGDDDWIIDYVADEAFDRIPWRVAKEFVDRALAAESELEELRRDYESACEQIVAMNSEMLVVEAPLGTALEHLRAATAALETVANDPSIAEASWRQVYEARTASAGFLAVGVEPQEPAP